MERVAFLLEATGERISCLLNPESVVVRRSAGVRPRSDGQGALGAARRADDPPLFTGGGRTELDLDLLFDVSLAEAGATLPLSGSPAEAPGVRAAEDVRRLTAPLWALAENEAGDDGYGRPAVVRFVWGKTWNLPGLITQVAERFEDFTPTGEPRRSWLRMRMLRTAEPAPRPATLDFSTVEVLPAPPEPRDVPPEQLRYHEVLGGGADGAADGGAAAAERIDLIADQYYGTAAAWRLIAAFNRLDDPTRLVPGTVLRLPPLAGLPATGGTA